MVLDWGAPVVMTSPGPQRGQAQTKDATENRRSRELTFVLCFRGLTGSNEKGRHAMRCKTGVRHTIQSKTSTARRISAGGQCGSKAKNTLATSTLRMMQFVPRRNSASTCTSRTQHHANCRADARGLDTMESSQAWRHMRLALCIMFSRS